MRILRNAFLAVGLMALAPACGGGQTEAAEPAPEMAPEEEGMGEEGMGEEGMGEEGMGEEGAAEEGAAEEGAEGGEW
jgi:hypothetical protein